MPSTLSTVEDPPGGKVPVVRTRRIQRILSSLETLPSLPTVVMRVMELADDANANAADFEKLLQQDPALAQRVLKLVNSPFFGLRHEVTSISHAVVLLGFRTLRSVVVAAKTSKLLNRQLVQYGFRDGGMWKHSMSCATICHFLAKRLELRSDEQERLFLAGLLHDVGKIVIAPQISEIQAEFDLRLRQNHGNLVKTERELVGISHDEIGGRMAEQWKLPPGLCGLIAGHHTRPRTPLAAVLATANDLCHQLGIGKGVTRKPAPGRAEWLQTAGLGDGATLLADLERPLAELQVVFESVVGE
ncbi:MAG: HDOD domain-containing protein [Gemmatimonadetes bacterium]|nr:HDOD domain-containing protein [Gemmatimonadota bacterium]